MCLRPTTSRLSDVAYEEEAIAALQSAKPHDVGLGVTCGHGIDAFGVSVVPWDSGRSCCAAEIFCLVPAVISRTAIELHLGDLGAGVLLSGRSGNFSFAVAAIDPDTGPPAAAQLRFGRPERFSGDSFGRSQDMS